MALLAPLPPTSSSCGRGVAIRKVCFTPAGVGCRIACICCLVCMYVFTEYSVGNHTYAYLPRYLMYLTVHAAITCCVSGVSRLSAHSHVVLYQVYVSVGMYIFPISFFFFPPFPLSTPLVPFFCFSFLSCIARTGLKAQCCHMPKEVVA